MSTIRMGGVAVVVLLGVAASLAAGYNAAASIEEIMEKAHKSKTGLRAQIADAADAASPDWPDIQKKTKEFVGLAADLGKNDPPKGEKSGWKKLTDAYHAEVKMLDAAATKKDAKAVKTANQKLGGSCKGCHDSHRE